MQSMMTISSSSNMYPFKCQPYLHSYQSWWVGNQPFYNFDQVPWFVNRFQGSFSICHLTFTRFFCCLMVAQSLDRWLTSIVGARRWSCSGLSVGISRNCCLSKNQLAVIADRFANPVISTETFDWFCFDFRVVTAPYQHPTISSWPSQDWAKRRTSWNGNYDLNVTHLTFHLVNNVCHVNVIISFLQEVAG